MFWSGLKWTEWIEVNRSGPNWTEVDWSELKYVDMAQQEHSNNDAMF